MVNTYFVAPTANFLQTTLNGAITNNQTTITLSSITNVEAPGYAVIDRQDSSGVNTPNAREIISYTGVSGNNLTGVVRGADSSSNLAHGDGAIVEFSPTIGMWNNLSTIVATAMTSDGYLKAIASPVSIAIGEFNRIAVASLASIEKLQIKTHAIASGASLSGWFTGFNAFNILPTTAQTTTSTSFVDMTAGVLSFTLDRISHIEVYGKANCVNTGTNATYLQITSGAGATIIGTQGYSTSLTDSFSVIAGGILTNVAAGNVTIAIQKKVAAGTGTFNQPNLSVLVIPAV